MSTHSNDTALLKEIEHFFQEKLDDHKFDTLVSSSPVVSIDFKSLKATIIAGEEGFGDVPVFSFLFNVQTDKEAFREVGIDLFWSEHELYVDEEVFFAETGQYHSFFSESDGFSWTSTHPYTETYQKTLDSLLDINFFEPLTDLLSNGETVGVVLERQFYQEIENDLAEIAIHFPEAERIDKTEGNRCLVHFASGFSLKSTVDELKSMMKKQKEVL